MKTRKLAPLAMFPDVPWLEERLFENRCLSCYAAGSEIAELVERVNHIGCPRTHDGKAAELLENVRSAAACLYLFATDALQAIPATLTRKKK